MLDEVVGRNRRRMMLVTTAAVLNYWVAVSIFGGIAVWGVILRLADVGDDGDVAVPGRLIGASSLVIGAVIAFVTVVWQVRSIRPRTLRGLGAAELALGEFPVLDDILAGVALAAGTDPVEAALVDDPAPNALAVGRRPSETSIVVTTGLIEKLTMDELEAVLAAEMCAIRRLDTALQSVTVACTSGAITVHMLWRDRPNVGSMLTWPSMACGALLRRWVLRSGDFGQDDMAIAITRHPEALLRALQKLRSDPAVVETLSTQTAPLWFEPVPHDDRRRAWLYQRLSFTPSLDERITRLAQRYTPTDRIGR
jgi:heat shock protein HtpX